MAGLSISRAWDETKTIVARDGKLFVSVALALVALPAAVSGLLSPKGMNDASSPLWVDLIILIGSLVALAGQLALIRLALGPSVTVGGAIGHGVRRMPIYLLSAILILIGLIILAIPFGAALAALGVPIEERSVPMTPAVVLTVILYLAVVFIFGVRMLMSAPAASAEPIGPVAIIKRSWELTRGHWWQLFGFVLILFVGAIVVLVAVNAAVGVVVGLFLGPIEPMSASALLVALVNALVNTAVTVLFAVMLARIYVQLSGRGEAQASVPTSGT
jgi:hypothetical protein